MRPETIAPANQFRLKNSLEEKLPVDKLPDQIWEHNPHLAGGSDDGSGSVINPDIDVFVSNFAHFSQTLTNSGDGTFTAGILSDGSHYSLGVALGDLDGDGDLDAIVTNLDGYNEILINDGYGNFTVTDAPGSFQYSVDVALGDLDGDGDVDAVVANASQPNQILINDGSGAFTAADLPGGSLDSRAIALGDLDGDGDLDAFVANFSLSGPNQILTNDGYGNFTATDVANSSLQSYDVALGDLDGDGDLDAFVANNSVSQPNQILFNNGDGTFETVDAPGGSQPSFGVALGDVDGDGDLDALVANYGGTNQILINNGDGSFSALDAPGGTQNSVDVVFGDLDGDGDLDAFVVNSGQPNQILTNDGYGAFTAADVPGDSLYSFGVALGDLDGDGDIPVVNADGLPNLGTDDLLPSMYTTTSNSVALNAALFATEAVVAGSVEMVYADQQAAESLSNLVSVDADDDDLEAALVLATAGGGSLDSLVPGPESTNLSVHADGLPDWHIPTTDGAVLVVDYDLGLTAGDNGPLDWVENLSSNPGLGSQLASAGDLIFLDFDSYARPSDPGGGGGSGGGGGNGNKGGSGGNGGGSVDPNVISEYISGEIPGAESPYNIEIDFQGAWTSTLQQAFIDASEWISSVIRGDLQDVFYRGAIIDDLRITAELVEIDGESGILGQAGPTAVRTADYLPATGIMEFDVADAQNFYDLGYWTDIVLHEMLHTVGFGSIWDLKGLIDTSTPDGPTFTGTEAVLAYHDLFGGTGDVPLEYGYGAGTDLSHWDEDAFDNELMTGFIDTDADDYVPNVQGNYVSGMTVASLSDLGYDVASYEQQVVATV